VILAIVPLCGRSQELAYAFKQCGRSNIADCAQDRPQPNAGRGADDARPESMSSYTVKGRHRTVCARAARSGSESEYRRDRDRHRITADADVIHACFAPVSQELAHLSGEPMGSPPI